MEQLLDKGRDDAASVLEGRSGVAEGDSQETIRIRSRAPNAKREDNKEYGDPYYILDVIDADGNRQTIKAAEKVPQEEIDSKMVDIPSLGPSVTPPSHVQAPSIPTSPLSVQPTIDSSYQRPSRSSTWYEWFENSIRSVRDTFLSLTSKIPMVAEAAQLVTGIAEGILEQVKVELGGLKASLNPMVWYDLYQMCKSVTDSFDAMVKSCATSEIARIRLTRYLKEICTNVSALVNKENATNLTEYLWKNAVTTIYGIGDRVGADVSKTVDPSQNLAQWESAYVFRLFGYATANVVAGAYSLLKGGLLGKLFAFFRGGNLAALGAAAVIKGGGKVFSAAKSMLALAGSKINDLLSLQFTVPRSVLSLRLSGGTALAALFAFAW